jgi:2,4-dienoyl-CoA reductase-like NADH-dependent reductase (Old Yellow Enzyme family)
MIVEATTVSPEGKLHANQLGIFDDAHLGGLAKLADIIDETGGVPGIQIHHAGGKATPEFTWGLTPLAPSVNGILSPVSKECRTLSEDEIGRIQDDFVKGALRAVEAGFRVIELHGAHGYLGSQFLSPLTNTRNDKYGGSLENRQRFIIETFRKCREAVGQRALVSCRLGVIDQDERGMTLEEGIETARRLEHEGASLLHISHAHNVPESVRPEGSRFDPLMHLAEAVRAGVNIPIIGVGGIIDPEDAEEALKRGMADFVAVGKAILADPAWAAKVVQGKADEIHLCIQCSPCYWFTTPNKCPVRIKHGRSEREPG